MPKPKPKKSHLTQKETNAKGGGDPTQPPKPKKGQSYPGSTFEDQGRPAARACATLQRRVEVEARP